jgi:hypothetical protein
MVKALLSFSPGARGNDYKTVSYGPKVEKIRYQMLLLSLLLLLIFN